MGAIPSLTTPHAGSGNGGTRSVVIAVAATFAILVLVFLLMFRDEISGLLTVDRGEPDAVAAAPSPQVSRDGPVARQPAVTQTVEQTRSIDASGTADTAASIVTVNGDEQPASAPLPVAISDNPPDGFPDIRIDALSYSQDPGKSFVMLDQQIFKTGSRVPGGLVIERIESEFIVVSYNGGRYRVRP